MNTRWRDSGAGFFGENSQSFEQFLVRGVGGDVFGCVGIVLEVDEGDILERAVSILLAPFGVVAEVTAVFAGGAFRWRGCGLRCPFECGSSFFCAAIPLGEAYCAPRLRRGHFRPTLRKIIVVGVGDLSD